MIGETNEATGRGRRVIRERNGAAGRGGVGELAASLREQREALMVFEGSALAGVAESLSVAADGLMAVLERIEESAPQDWMTPEKAALYVGYEWEDGSSAGRELAVEAYERLASAEGIPCHRLSARKKLYNRREVDDFLFRR